MLRSLATRIARARVLGKSPVNAYLRLNSLVWKRVPSAVAASAPVHAYGSMLHALVRLSAIRRQNFGTFFFRNRPLLELIRRLADRHPSGSRVSLVVLACSNGSELYSILWTIRSMRPDLDVIVHAVDISPEIVALAQQGDWLGELRFQRAQPKKRCAQRRYPHALAPKTLRTSRVGTRYFRFGRLRYLPRSLARPPPNHAHTVRGTPSFRQFQVQWRHL